MSTYPDQSASYPDLSPRRRIQTSQSRRGTNFQSFEIRVCKALRSGWPTPTSEKLGLHPKVDPARARQLRDFPACAWATESDSKRYGALACKRQGRRETPKNLKPWDRQSDSDRRGVYANRYQPSTNGIVAGVSGFLFAICVGGRSLPKVRFLKGRVATEATSKTRLPISRFSIFTPRWKFGADVLKCR